MVNKLTKEKVQIFYELKFEHFSISLYIAFHLKKVNLVKNSRDLQSLLTGEFINVHVIHAQNWGTLMTVW